MPEQEWGWCVAHDAQEFSGAGRCVWAVFAATKGHSHVCDIQPLVFVPMMDLDRLVGDGPLPEGFEVIFDIPADPEEDLERVRMISRTVGYQRMLPALPAELAALEEATR